MNTTTPNSFSNIYVNCIVYEVWYVLKIGLIYNLIFISLMCISFLKKNVLWDFDWKKYDFILYFILIYKLRLVRIHSNFLLISLSSHEKIIVWYHWQFKFRTRMTVEKLSQSNCTNFNFRIRKKSIWPIKVQLQDLEKRKYRMRLEWDPSSF